MAPASKRVVWSPKARQDLLHIARYFTRVASSDIADKLAAAAQRLGERPLIGRAREEVMSSLRSALVHPYHLTIQFFRIRSDFDRVRTELQDAR